MLNLNSLILFSDNPKMLSNFYKKTLGMNTSWEGGDFTGFKLGDGMLVIGPHDKVKGKSTQPERILFNIETDNLEKDYERIKNAGAKVIAKPYHPGEDPKMTIATFADSDGNYFQLGTPME